MRPAISASLLLMIATASVAAADFTEIAPVVSATPIVERVTEQRQECAPGATAAPAQEKERNLAAPILGGVAGAVLGHQVGRGSGKTAATAAGAIAGAVVGDRIGNRQQAAAPPAGRCRSVETPRDVVKGYTVVYRYNGRDITTILPHDPGPTVRVGIGVLDGTPASASPTATMMGSNVREVESVESVSPASAAPAATPAAANPISNPGGYSYRY